MHQFFVLALMQMVFYSGRLLIIYFVTKRVCDMQKSCSTFNNFCSGLSFTSLHVSTSISWFHWLRIFSWAPAWLMQYFQLSDPLGKAQTPPPHIMDFTCWDLNWWKVWPSGAWLQCCLYIVMMTSSHFVEVRGCISLFFFIPGTCLTFPIAFPSFPSCVSCWHFVYCRFTLLFVYTYFPI